MVRPHLNRVLITGGTGTLGYNQVRHLRLTQPASKLRVLMLTLDLELFADLRFGVSLSYTRLPWRQRDQKFFVADKSKAERLLRWSPKTEKARGIEDTLRWESRQQRAV